MNKNFEELAPQQLLTPADVAELLQVSEKTVYKHRNKLCGFNPAGLGVLRFRKEIIYGIMEGQEPEALVLQFPVSKGNVCRKRIQNKKGSNISPRKQKKRIKRETDENRHGLFGNS